MPDEAAREILVAGAHAIAHVEDPRSALQAILDPIASNDIGSAAIAITGAGNALEIAATFGLDDAARAGLATAIGRPTHPIALAMHETTSTFDVLPTVPGGPALRSHLPLVVTRGGTDSVLGVLALAHDAPIDAELRPVLEAVADLAAVAVERGIHR